MGDPALEEFCFWFAGADGEGVEASFVYDGNLLVSTRGAHNMSTLFVHGQGVHSMDTLPAWCFPNLCRAPLAVTGRRGGELAGSMWPRPHRSPISQRPFGAYTTAYSGRANRGYQLGSHTLVTKLVNTLVTTAAPHFLRPVVSRASQLGRMSTGASAWVAAARLSSSHCYAFAGSLSAVSTTCRLVCPVLAVIRPRLAAAFGESKLTGHNGA